jgi:O-antigen/teichoic acid export membrane protein
LGVIQRQGFKNALSSYVGIALGFLSLIVIQPKLLKPEEIGLVRVLFAFSALVGSFIPLGISNIILKYFPKYKNPEKGHHGFLGFSIIFPIVGFLLSALFLIVFKEFIIAQYRRESPLIIEYYNYIFPFSLFMAFIFVTTNYLTALFKSTVPSYLNDIYTRVAYIVLIGIYFFGWITLPQFVSVYIGIYGLQLLLMIYYLVQVDTPTLSIDWSYFKKEDVIEMLKFGAALSLTAVAALGLKSVDAILIGKFLPLGFVGIYAIASFIPNVIETPLTALDRIVNAKVAHSIAEGNIDEVKDVFYKSVKYMTVVGGLLFVGINCNIEYLLQLVGKNYEQGVAVVWIISIGAFVNMMGGSSNSIIVYSSKYWLAAGMLLSLVLINFALNMVLIPKFGINGAAMSTAISSFAFTALKFLLVNRRFGFQPYSLKTVFVIVSVGICAGVNYLLPEFDSAILNIFYKSSLVTLLYICCIYLFKVVPEFFTRDVIKNYFPF